MGLHSFSDRRAGDIRGPAAQLTPAYAALEAGCVQQARELAQSLVDAALDDTRLQAHALACLAHVDRVSWQLRRAAESSRRAAQWFEQLGDAVSEARALTTLAHVSALRGRTDEAVEAALLSVRLSDAGTPRPQTVLAYDSLGLAYCGCSDHERADAALERAIGEARRCLPDWAVYQPRLHQAWVEALRLLEARYHAGALPSLGRLQRLLDECRSIGDGNDPPMLLPGLRPMGRTVSLGLSALLALWQHDLAAGTRALQEARESLMPSASWLDALVRWCAAEAAWALGDWAGAERELNAMREMAAAVEHEQLVCIAHLLLAQVYEVQGRHVAAHRVQRVLHQRAQRASVDSLARRESWVAWQLGARQNERRLQQVLVATKQFERWSMEDALTGLANRRQFEHALAQMMHSAAAVPRPLAVAMIDVDRFKQVNDQFTHCVGDRVLKTIAAIVSGHVRERDLPARWAGDEFVVLFHNATVTEARRICDRIQAAVADFDWHGVAPGLRIAVSIGVGAALADDTPEMVVHRSDESMYESKPMRE